MIYSKIPLAQCIVEICLAKGVTDVVISPGSRNAPLTIGFVNNPRFICYSIVDERCAAFFALGIAQQTRRPVVIVCTSGSALLNYYPAFAEAFYSQIPIVVISADRPLDKIDIGDGQTIRQQNVYQNHSLYNANLLECSDVKQSIAHESFNVEEINKAIQCALLQKGPVHINAPFEEPLYETTSRLSVYPQIFPLEQQENKITQDELIFCSKLWNVSARKLILIGVQQPHSIDEAVMTYWANDPSVMVMTETTSNLHHSTFFTTIDTLITPFTTEDFIAFQPDILVTFGGMVVSKRIKAFLRHYKPKEHWHIDPLRGYDTYGALTYHFEVEPNWFFNLFLPLTIPLESDYRSKMAHIDVIRKIKQQKYLETISFSDLKVFEILLRTLPKNCLLQFSNSSTIRYAQLFAIDSSIEVFCNRGTSGIDGSTSTALGAAVASRKKTVLITGDISFFYDSNALWNNYIPKNFKIILINNGGGGIFRILPGHQESDVFATYFETVHQYNASHMAKMYGFAYYEACHADAIYDQISSFYTNDHAPAIFEIFTPTDRNDTILKDYFKMIF